VLALIPTVQPELREPLQHVLNEARLMQIVREFLEGNIDISDIDEDC
jgi:hypothetical protein